MNVEFGQMLFDIYKKNHIRFCFLLRTTMVSYVNKLLCFFSRIKHF